ncbi:MAG: beta-ketoacyl-[acyl-carrier-protein] synthase family protein [Solirubrobacteraceae bacterium]
MTQTADRPSARAVFHAAVTGIGLVTPAGIGELENWAQVCAGVSTAATDPALAGLQVDFSCRIPQFDADELLGRKIAWRIARFVQLALIAARQAVASAGLDSQTWEGDRIAIVVGNSLGGTQTMEDQQSRFLEEGAKMVSPMTIPAAMMNMVAGHLAIDLAATGPSMVTATACASGTTAIGLARSMLRSGECDIVIAGGAESALSQTAMATLSKMGALSQRSSEPRSACRPFDAARDGFVAAEAAGFLVLERMSEARARDAPIRALVSGYGAASDAHHPTMPHPDGAGIERAMRTALNDAHLDGTEIDHVNAHGTSTPLNDSTEAAAVRRVLGQRPAVTSTKGVTGHTLAAAGAIEAAYAVLAIEHQMVPPTANLDHLDPLVELDIVTGEPRPMPVAAAMSTSLGFGGHNAALVITSASA